MDIYLVQHGEAKAKEDDADRPLTEKGRKEAALVAVRLARAGVKVEAIWHSGKLRARQTAAIFADPLKPAVEPQEKRGLAPLDDPENMAGQLAEQTAAVMLVGHLPQLSRLASLLLVGDAEREIVRFRNAGVVCLSNEDDAWRLSWCLTPELAESLTEVD